MNEKITDAPKETDRAYEEKVRVGVSFRKEVIFDIQEKIVSGVGIGKGIGG